MNSFWSYFWPIFALGLVLGAAGATLWFRRKQRLALAAAALIAFAGAAIWHGPLGAARELRMEAETMAQASLVDWEMTQVNARLHRNPLSRRLMLSGPADDFQRAELVRILSAVPGVSSATWSRSGGVPLIIEAMLVTAGGFLLGLLLAYVVERRRRYNAQWSW